MGAYPSKDFSKQLMLMNLATTKGTNIKEFGGAMAVIVSRRPAVCSLAFSPLVAVLALAFVVSSRPGSATCDGGTTSCFSPSLQSGATCTPSNHLQTPGGIATCGGQMWERITCHNPTTCADHYGMCRSWDACSCCSAVPLYKCLSPFAEQAFAPECSGPIDGRQQCCGDAVTHERTTDVEETIKHAVNSTVTGTAQWVHDTRERCASKHGMC